MARSHDLSLSLINHLEALVWSKGRVFQRKTLLEPIAMMLKIIPNNLFGILFVCKLTNSCTISFVKCNGC